MTRTIDIDLKNLDITYESCDLTQFRVLDIGEVDKTQVCNFVNFYAVAMSVLIDDHLSYDDFNRRCKSASASAAAPEGAMEGPTTEGASL